MILFVDSLTVIDFSYLCNKRGPVGESWIVDLNLHGHLNNESMVLDFALVKKQIKKIIDETIDHKLAIATGFDGHYLYDNNQVTLYHSFGNDCSLAMSAPKEAVCNIDSDEVNQESVIRYLKNVILPKLPSNVKDIDITLRAEETSNASYHYSHGLKKHDGNCQRIIHGHRSQIQIKSDNKPSFDLQVAIAKRWKDIYLGSKEDIISSEKLQYVKASDSQYCFAYHSTQGYFELAISKDVCEILPCDTTVECIAEFLANDIKGQYPEKEIMVKAFEGVGKGAIAYA